VLQPIAVDLKSLSDALADAQSIAIGFTQASKNLEKSLEKNLEKNPDKRINSLAIFGSKDNLQSKSISQFVTFYKYKKVLFVLGVLTV
jgi:hypothetical protein